MLSRRDMARRTQVVVRSYPTPDGKDTIYTLLSGQDRQLDMQRIRAHDDDAEHNRKIRALLDRAYEHLKRGQK